MKPPRFLSIRAPEVGEGCATCKEPGSGRMLDTERRQWVCTRCVREIERAQVRALAARYVPANEREQETAAAIVAAQVPDVRRADAESWALALFRERDEAQARTLRRAGFLRGTE